MNSIAHEIVAVAARVDRHSGEYRATFEHRGAAAMGYGATPEAAKADLAATISFNLERNGCAV